MERLIPKDIPMGTEVLQVKNMTKNFGAVQALIDANLTLRAGEVHALVGGNGAGKSTLVNILCGFLKPTKGELYVFGKQRELHQPKDARYLGIGTVHQLMYLVEPMNVIANIFLGQELVKPPPLGWFGVMDLRRMRSAALSEIQRLRINIPYLGEQVRKLSGGQRQGVVFARALIGEAPIMLLDEPTAALGVKEGGEVIRLINQIREEGAAVLLISHNMKEVFAMSQRITVLRLGEVVAEGVETSRLTEEEVVGLITGAIDSMDEYEANRNSRPAGGYGYYA
ncbi:MAG: ATP-binding cassette domain-containing protein [Clostridiales bacterium]|nr:ATP-binding cassette domain-containing protein [Clostridiales bacterium]